MADKNTGYTEHECPHIKEIRDLMVKVGVTFHLDYIPSRYSPQLKCRLCHCTVFLERRFA